MLLTFLLLSGLPGSSVGGGVPPAPQAVAYAAVAPAVWPAAPEPNISGTFAGPGASAGGIAGAPVSLYNASTCVPPADPSSPPPCAALTTATTASDG